MAADSGRELEDLIDAVTASYDGSKSIDTLESAKLPNKKRCAEGLRELMATLFGGFYSERSLNRSNLRHTVSERLYRARDLLLEPIERALTYNDWHGTCARCPKPGSGEEILFELFASLPRLRELAAGDLEAALQGDPAAESIEEIVFSYPTTIAVTSYRLAHQLHRSCVPMIPRIWTEDAHARTGIDIHPGAQIGERFFVDHGTGVVIGATAVIGNDVKLYQGVTLGALSIPGRGDLRKRHPTLEDNVTIYAHATILGGETTVGAGSVIGGNVWLTESVAPQSKVFGRPRSLPPEQG